MVAVEIIIIVLMTCIILYLLSIMPHMLHKPDMEPFKQVLYAHRGLHSNESKQTVLSDGGKDAGDAKGICEAPENSMAAFRKAVDAGYGIELDIQLTKDKVLVVFHDFTLKRMCDAPGKVCDYTYEELQNFTLLDSVEKIPKFTDVLQLVDGRVPLIIELKIEATDTSACRIADEILQNYEGLYCIESFNPLGVYWYHRNRPGVVRGQLSDAFLANEQFCNPLYFLMEMLMFNFLTKPDFVAYNHKHERNLSRRLCRSLYRNTAVAYTIKSEDELKRAKEHFDIYIFDSFVPSERWGD